MGKKKRQKRQFLYTKKQKVNLRNDKNSKKEKPSYTEKQKRKRNIIKSLVFGFIAVIVGLGGWAGYEWYDANYKPMHQIVVNVNGTKFDMEYYIDMLTYVSGDYPTYASYFTSYALSYTEYFEQVRQEAEALGYTVTKKEIAAEMESDGYDYDDNTQAFRDAVRAYLLVTKLKEGYFNASVPTSAEQNYVMAMFLESEAQVADVKARIAAGETFADIAAELSLDSTTQTDSGDLGWLPDGVISDILGTSVLDGLISEAEAGILNQILDEDTTKDVGYWLLKVTAKDTEAGTATVQAMLLGSEAEAEEVLAKLNAGGDFVTLAEEYSQTWDETNGCELTVAEGDYSDVFEAYALYPDVEIGAVSGIIRDAEKSTTGGYWLYEVMGRGIQDISDANRTILIDNALSDWLDALDRTNIVEYLDDDMISFAVSKVTGE